MSAPYDRISLSNATKAAIVSELRRKASAPTPWPSLLTTMLPEYGATSPSLTEADVRRIVREEIEAAKPGPLDVTPEDVRRYLGGPRV